MKNNSNGLLSDIATNERHGENSPYFDGWKAYNSYPYHPIHRPDGVIQMGLAENQLCFDKIRDWISNNPKASICTPEGVHMFNDIAIFQDYHGLPEFRQAIARFMERVRGDKVKFDPERIVMGGGATGANELVMFCLANPGDAFLVPSPYYPAFDRDLGWRTGVQIIPVHCDSSNNFKITRAALESAYDKATRSGINVKGLIIANPSNPLGTILDRSTLESLVSFVNAKRIHFVCDEIYAATTFSSSYDKYVSLAEIVRDADVASCDPDLIHIVYSLSKDMGLPGLRVGIVYSYNDDVVACGRKMSSFGLVSSQTQHLLAAMLSDEEFVGKFLEESSRRLEERHGRFTKGLERVGIRCLDSNAGLFVWMDLRHLLKEVSYEGEMALWRVIVDEVKLNVSPGVSFHCVEPGWFRVCFANMDEDTMEVALQRIRDFINKREGGGVGGGGDNKNKRRWQKNNLRLSFKTTRILEEGQVASPNRMMSPHSPIPHSPLVRAKT
ncbi:1-aminocyclopropane-1-carboxylate synthase 1 [Linum grandiflorum]